MIFWCNCSARSACLQTAETPIILRNSRVSTAACWSKVMKKMAISFWSFWLKKYLKSDIIWLLWTLVKEEAKGKLLKLNVFSRVWNFDSINWINCCYPSKISFMTFTKRWGIFKKLVKSEASKFQKSSLNKIKSV